ncbi:MAG: GntR family transcriptional regulator [Pseudomonadota bacterium]
MKNETTVTSDTKADQVHRRVKAAILQGQFVPGEKLVAHQLAQRFNTSIIPVREALSRLEAEDLVTVVPHTGIYVKNIDLDQLRELYPIRGLLEGYAVRLAADRLVPDDFARLWGLVRLMDEAAAQGDAGRMGEYNREFHLALYGACGNQSLVDLIDELWQKTILARLIFKLTPKRAEASNREHRKILEYLEQGKKGNAERLVVRQSEKTLKLLVRQLAGLGF